MTEQGPAPSDEEDFGCGERQSPSHAAGVTERLDPRAIPDAEFRLLADNLPTLCWIANADGYIVWYNRRWHEYCGTTPEQMEGWGWQSVHDPEQLPGVMERWQASIASGEPFEMTFPLRGADGVFRPFLTRVQSVRDPDGRVVRWFGVNTDVSEQTAAQAALRRSEAEARRAAALLEAIGESSPSLIYAKGLDDRIIYANAATLAVFGKSAEETIGRTPAEIAGRPDEVDAHYENDRRIAERGEVQTMEEVFTTPDGVTRTYRSTKAPLRNSDGEIIGIAGFSTDMTEHLAIEAALRAGEERLRIAMAAGRLGDWSWDAATDAVTLSPEAARIFGVSVDEPISWTQMQERLLHPEDAPAAADAVRRAVETGGDYQAEYRHRDAQGGVTWIAAHGRLTFAPDGRPAGMTGVVQDVTERRRAEEHQRLLINELNHRVKNMLAIVQGMAHQTFKGRGVSAEAKAAFEGRLGALSAAHNILTGQNWESASMCRIIEETIAPHRSRPGQFIAEGPDVPLPPKTAVSLALAIHELATNAVKYGALRELAGRVELRWRADEGRLRLVWRESGGPPVEPPPARGFGTRMIERGLASEFGGEVCIEFMREGLVCTVDAPLPQPGN